MIMNESDALNWIASVFEAPAGSLRADTPSSSIAGWDSLGILSLIAELDEKFDIQLEEAEIYAIKGVADILGLLARSGALSMA
jgi:acyl carrier protein